MLGSQWPIAETSLRPRFRSGKLVGKLVSTVPAHMSRRSGLALALSPVRSY